MRTLFTKASVIQRARYGDDTNKALTTAKKRDKTHSQVLWRLRSQRKPVASYNTCFCTEQRIASLTFPCSEKVGNILDAGCTLLLEHRKRDAQGRPYGRGVRIVKTRE